ncbi:hypothetical protein FSP39_010124 [Pinctada imbricata]|uniref:G-protein coupled receptors family 1 profile domain-containing protein n=1 Tax=Pinctada imbricata TaxID=66713 RepID=A0AA88YTS5_PINIB|nr:hypothetical protein FSP39_010124 [Pinctada imbricata]
MNNSTNNGYFTSNVTLPSHIAITESPADLVQAKTLDEAASWLWIILAPILMFVGIVGNIFNLIVLMRLHCQRNPTLLLLAILALTDMAVLIVGLPRYFLQEVTDPTLDIRDVSAFSCKFSLFLIYFTMQLSSWLLVLVSVIRLIKTAPYQLLKLRVSMTRAMFAFGGITVFLAFLNLHFFFTNGIIDDECNSLTPEIYEFEEKGFVYVDLMFLSVLPALILIICNVSIYKTVKRIGHRRTSVTAISKSTQHSASRVTHMLLFTSTYFIAANVPISLYFIVDSYVKAGEHQYSTGQSEEHDLDSVLSVSILTFRLKFLFLYGYQ